MSSREQEPVLIDFSRNEEVILKAKQIFEAYLTLGLMKLS